ncbi:MAG: hypothetical protein Q8Q88_23960 [Phenylobacterium sp.]|uniref:hypothetical protein n=1 Tax=Phenylobacterium sp. TaxID=1871053 RepID=UPI0027354CB5|nr:hypothetical protein [Phenylobacterium sp.]MDP3750092.1 hypothetical protein [Phenylobacterium sp.]
MFHLGQTIYFEIKQIDADKNFTSELRSRTVGNHVRARIKAARGQMRTVAEDGHQAILLVMNNLDGLQLFGTEQTDFVAAMYGQWEVEYDENSRMVDSYHGENRAFRPGANHNFSGVGFILRTRTVPAITVYENIHARWPIKTLPAGFDVVRFETADAQP